MIGIAVLHGSFTNLSRIHPHIHIFTLLILNPTDKEKVKGGGTIIIGPIPILFREPTNTPDRPHTLHNLNHRHPNHQTFMCTRLNH